MIRRIIASEKRAEHKRRAGNPANCVRVLTRAGADALPRPPSLRCRGGRAWHSFLPPQGGKNEWSEWRDLNPRPLVPQSDPAA